MRTPLEIWLREHREAIEHADKLVELLAPSDIQARLVQPDESKLRVEIAGHLDAFVEMARVHFRNEEEHLVPAIASHIDVNRPSVKEALGCLSREHAQMHMFAERVLMLLPGLQAGEALKPAEAAELLRVSYGVQSLMRHHCSKEERDVYPLMDELPPRVVEGLMEILAAPDDIKLDHLLKPLGEGEDLRPRTGDGAEGPEN